MVAREVCREARVDKKKMMECYQELGTPGEPHKLLARMAGKWDAMVKAWMEPGAPPTESKARFESRMVLGGRFLQEEFTGEMSGMPFTGIGIAGYDNHTEKYVSTWADSMGTAIMFFEGTAGADGKTITQESRYDDPIRGPMKWRSVTKIVDDDNHLFEIYASDQSGKEEKMLEIVYTRKR